jgi:hypothetical protein
VSRLFGLACWLKLAASLRHLATKVRLRTETAQSMPEDQFHAAFDGDLFRSSHAFDLLRDVLQIELVGQGAPARVQVAQERGLAFGPEQNAGLLVGDVFHAKKVALDARLCDPALARSLRARGQKRACSGEPRSAQRYVD